MKLLKKGNAVKSVIAAAAVCAVLTGCAKKIQSRLLTET